MTPPQLYIAKSGAKPAPALPADAITRTFGILGQRGTGKTTTAVVLAEEMVRRDGHVAVLDPVGAWWGLTRAGERAGMPGIVLGGEHGDVPLEEGAGQLVAELVIDRHYPVVVIDMKMLRKGAQIRFMADFCEALFHSNRAPLHLIFEEADRALPQMVRSVGGQDFAATRLLGAGEDIVKLGRSRGLGATLVTQRPATVNKNVLEQVEALIVHRLIGPNDRKAIKTWIEANGDAKATATVMDSIASMKLGEAWIYAPVLDLLERVRIRGRRTFDSSATPDASVVEESTKRAPVNLAELRDRMAETVERAKANDPKLLRAEVERLRRQLEEANGPREVETVEREVPVLPRERFDTLEAMVLDVQAVADRVQEIVAEPTGRVLAYLEEMQSEMRAVMQRVGPVPVVDRQRRAVLPVSPALPRPSRNGTGASSAPREDGDLTGPQQRVLDAIAWWAAIGVTTPTKIQVGFVAGYRVGKKVGGTYGNLLGQLRSAGLIDYPPQGGVALTDAGAVVATDPDIRPTTADLQAAVYARLKDPERRVLGVAISAYPGMVSKQDVGESAGYTVGEKIGGTFGNILGRLRSLGLIDYPAQGMVVATDILFIV